MGLFRGRGRGRSGSRAAARKERAAEQAALVEFISTRRGVEGYLEPRTSVTQTTVVFVAADGEWTRKPFDTPKAAADFSRKHRVPLYDTNKVGYPQRMRDYSARQAGANARRTSSPRHESSRASTSTTTRASRRSPEQVKAIKELQFIAETSVGEEDLDDESLRRLVRQARAKAHPDRSGGDRTSWDRVDRAARTLGLD